MTSWSIKNFARQNDGMLWRCNVYSSLIRSNTRFWDFANHPADIWYVASIRYVPFMDARKPAV
jgi:hypothetical protein